MDTDLFLVMGIIVFALALPSMLSAWVDGRVPRMGSALVLIGTGLIAAALVQKPGGYDFGEMPEVFLRVLGRYLG